MKIEKNTITYVQQNNRNNEKQTKEIKEKEKTIEIKQTKVNLDKINEIKKQIKDGTYKINPEAISEKILQDKKLLNKLMA